MARWHGVIGFSECVETSPGVWEDRIVEKEYYGDVLRANIGRQSSGYLNNNVNISNQISIIGNPYACQQCRNIRYIEFMGNKWNVSDISIESYPRINLTIGGVYTGEESTT